MRCIYSNVCRDDDGDILNDATIKVYLAGTTTAATIYGGFSDTTAISTSSVTTNIYGEFTFYVDRFDYDSDQRFKYTVVKTGYTTRTYDNVHIDRVIITTYTITADKTVTTNINVPYGVLYDCTGCTLTFAGAFEAGYYQIFTGTGTVTGLSEAVLEWWGGAGDDSTDNTAAYLSAVASLGGGNTTSVSNAGVLYIGKGIYRFSSALPITNIANVIVQGAGATYMNGFKVPATSIRYTGTAATFMSFIGNYCRGWTFRDLAIEYSSSSFTGTLVDIQTPGIDFDNVSFGGIGYTGSMTDTFTAQYLVKLATFECIIFNKCQFQKAKKGIYINDAPGSGSGPLTITNSVFYTLTEGFIEQAAAGNFSLNIEHNVFDVSINDAAAQISDDGIILKTAGLKFIGNELSGWTTRTPTGAWLRLVSGSGVVQGNSFRSGYTGIIVDSFTGKIDGNYYFCKLPLSILAGTSNVSGNGNYYSGTNTPNMAVSIAPSYDSGFASVNLGPDTFTNDFAYSYYTNATGASSTWQYVSGTLNIDYNLDSSTNGPVLNNHVKINQLNIRDSAHDADYTVTYRDAGIVLSNRGATGEVIFTLPTPVMGLRYTFVKYEDEDVTINTAVGTDYIMKLNSLATSIANTTGSEAYAFITLEGYQTYLGGQMWRIVDSLGTWV